MKNFKIMILASVFLGTSVSFANTNTHTPTDVEIVSAIHNKFADDKTTADLKVNVNIKHGEVTLTGKVNTSEEADKLIQKAESTPGVRDVDATNLTYKKSHHLMSDSTITAKVKGMYMREKLFGDKDISIMGVKVETTNGTVYLTGEVDTLAEADNAVKYAKAVHGVKRVESKLAVKSAR